jgi:hypothetical protein
MNLTLERPGPLFALTIGEGWRNPDLDGNDPDNSMLPLLLINVICKFKVPPSL